MKAEFQKYWIVIVLAAMLIFGSIGIAAPFIDGRQHWNWGPAFWLVSAKAINQVGLPAARFGVVSSVREEDGRIGFYQSHPQFIGPVVALWTRLFGYAEWSIRLLALTLTAISGLIFWSAFRSFFGLRMANIFVSIWAALPIVYVYGRKMDQEQLVTLFLAVAFLGIAKIQNSNYALRTTHYARSPRPWLFFFGVLGMTLSDWSGFVFAVLLAMVLSFFGREARLLQAAALSAAVLGGFLLIVQFVLQGGDAAGYQGFVYLYNYRSNLGPLGAVEWLGKQAVYLYSNFGPLIAVLPIAVIAAAGSYRKRTGKERLALLFLLAVFLGQTIYLLLLPQVSYIHLYYQTYYSIVFAGALALVPSQIRRPALGIAGAALSVLVAAYGAEDAFWRIQRTSYGDKTDIQLLRKLTVYSGSMDVGVLGKTDMWFANPNVEYYSGRTVREIVPGEATIPDVFIVYSSEADKLTEGLTERSGGVIKPEKKFCSIHFCIVESGKLRE